MENYWMSKRSLAAAMTLTLASCGPSGTVVYYADYGRYSGSAATYAGIDGYIPVEVIGNPTEAESSHFAEHIVQGLDGSHFNPAIRFVASDPTDDSQYRVVAAQLRAMGKMLFPPTNPNYSHDCEEDSIQC